MMFVAGFLSFYFTPEALPFEYQSLENGRASISFPLDVKEEKDKKNNVFVAHVATPEAVKAIYMTSCVAGTPSFREKLIRLAEETEINSIIIDVKDYSGRLAFPPESESLSHAYPSTCAVADLRGVVEDLHDRGIYVIARITVFQDPHLAMLRPDLAVLKESDRSVWKDNKGLSFTDPGAREVWDYTVRIAKETHALGFDELNFDYIRFPSDGPMKDIYFPKSQNRPKADVLEDFFKFLSEELDYTDDSGHKPVLSADLFGMTTNAVSGFDLNIGQVWEKTLPYFDYISPMVYPSHYPSGFNGWKDPNKHPYEIVNFAISEAVKKTVATSTRVFTIGSTEIASTSPALYTKKAYDKNKVRPWLQDFDYGGNYDIAEVKAQIQAVYDVGLSSWLLWSPSNVYTRGALLSSQDVN